MKTLTLFEAYNEALSVMRLVESRRGNHFGIAVHEDEDARYWQRLRRLTIKLDRRIRKALGDTDLPLKTCIICGRSGYSCECKHRGWTYEP